MHVSTSSMQQKISKQFPLTRTVLGVAPVTISQPVLGTDPTNNKLTTQLAVQMPSVLAVTPALNGSADIAYSLRFEPSDNSIRMTQVEVRRVDLHDSENRSISQINKLLQQAGQKWLQDYSVYKLTDSDLAKVKQYNYHPAGIQVKADGIDVQLVPN